MVKTRSHYRVLGAAAFEVYRRWRNSARSNKLSFKYPYGLNFPQSLRIPQRSGRSFTQTKTKDEEEMNHEDSVQGFKKIYCNVSTGLPNLKGVQKGTITYRDAYDAYIAWNNQIERLANVCYIGTTSQYITATPGTTLERSLYSYTPWFDLNPLQGIAAGANIAATTAPDNDWIGVKSCQLYFDFVSKCTVPVIVKIHFFVAKNDTNDDILSNYTDAANACDMYNTNYAFGVGNAIPATSGNEQVSYGAATTSVPATLDAIPYTNVMSKRLVRSSWKKIKTKTFVLAAADTQNVTCNVKLNQFGVRERLINIGVSYPRGCLATVFEFQGAAIKVAATDDTTISGGVVGWVITRKIHMCPLKSPNKRFETTYVGRGTVAQGGGVTTNQLFSESLSAVVGQQIL